MRCIFYAAGCAQWRLFDRVGKVYPVVLAVIEKILNRRRHVAEGYDDLGNAMALEQIKYVADNGLVDNGDQRFGPAIGAECGLRLEAIQVGDAGLVHE